MKTLALKRHNDWKKAVRKRGICLHEYSWEYYDNLHQYSKNKIHCSCPRCSAKTNDKINKSKGPVSYWKSCKISSTHDRYGKKNYKVSDKKKIDSLLSKYEDYLQENIVKEIV